MLHRTDFKTAYTNRALIYFKLKQYSKCVLDCSMVIERCQCVYSSDAKQRKSNELFKAYLRRANVLLLLANESKIWKQCVIRCHSQRRRSQTRLTSKIAQYRWEWTWIEWLLFCVQSKHSIFAKNRRWVTAMGLRLRADILRNYCVVFMCWNCASNIWRKSSKFCAILKTKQRKKKRQRCWFAPFRYWIFAVNLKEFKKRKHLKSTHTLVKYVMFYWNEMNEYLKGQSMKFI